MVTVRGHGLPKHASWEEDVRKLFAVLSASALFMVAPAVPLAGASHHLRNRPPNRPPNHQGQGQQQQQGQSQSQCILVLGLLMPATC
jgi:hypothetical protein